MCLRAANACRWLESNFGGFEGASVTDECGLPVGIGVSLGRAA